jgi:uncharacterized protein with HEPN domain
MSRDSRLYLQDILDAIAKIERYVAGFDLERFKQSDLILDAVNMNLIIIGEAANSVPDGVQQAHPEIDWRNVVGLRNAIAHEYFRLNLDRIWNIVEVEVPRLKAQLEVILEESDTSDGKK